MSVHGVRPREGSGLADVPCLPQSMWSITQLWRSRRACLSIRALMQARAPSSLSAKPIRRSTIFVRSESAESAQEVVIALADLALRISRRPSILPQFAHLSAGCSCQVRGREASSSHGARVESAASVARLDRKLYRHDCDESKPRAAEVRALRRGRTRLPPIPVPLRLCNENTAWT